METHQFGGPWTVEKLDALRAYLNAYAQALKNQPFRRYYIDAFAGTGDRAVKRQEAASLLEIPELDVMTKGSARVALEIEPPFDRYIFIEKRRRRSSALEHLKAEFPTAPLRSLTKMQMRLSSEFAAIPTGARTGRSFSLTHTDCRSPGKLSRLSPRRKRPTFGCSTQQAWA